MSEALEVQLSFKLSFRFVRFIFLLNPFLVSMVTLVWLYWIKTRFEFWNVVPLVEVGITIKYVAHSASSSLSSFLAIPIFIQNRTAPAWRKSPTLMTSSEAFVETMVAHDTRHIFGIVGSAYMDALDIFEPAGIRFVSVQHEQNAVSKLLCSLNLLMWTSASGQSYKAPTIVNYDSRVVIWGIFKSGTTLES